MSTWHGPPWVEFDPKHPMPIDKPLIVWLAEPMLGLSCHAALVVPISNGTMTMVGGHFDFDCPAITHWMLAPRGPNEPE